MRKLSVILMTIPVSVGGIAHATTMGIEGSDRGLPVISGGTGQIHSYGQSLVVLNTDNTLIANPIDVKKLVPIDNALGYGAIDAPCAVGYLTPGQEGTVYTFDRLAYVPVLQILGFEHAQTLDEYARVVDRTPFLPPPVLSHGTVSGFEEQTGGTLAKTTPVPLPPAAAMGVIGLLMATMRSWARKMMGQRQPTAG